MSPNWRRANFLQRSYLSLIYAHDIKRHLLYSRNMSRNSAVGIIESPLKRLRVKNEATEWVFRSSDSFVSPNRYKCMLISGTYLRSWVEKLALFLHCKS